MHDFKLFRMPQNSLFIEKKKLKTETKNTYQPLGQIELKNVCCLQTVEIEHLIISALVGLRLSFSAIYLNIVFAISKAQCLIYFGSTKHTDIESSYIPHTHTHTYYIHIV